MISTINQGGNEVINQNLINRLFILKMQLQKHMLSDKKWYDWLTGRVAAVGGYYELALELQKCHLKWLVNSMFLTIDQQNLV